MLESDLAASVPRFPGLIPFEYFDTNDAATVVDKSDFTHQPSGKTFSSGLRVLSPVFVNQSEFINSHFHCARASPNLNSVGPALR